MYYNLPRCLYSIFFLIVQSIKYFFILKDYLKLKVTRLCILIIKVFFFFNILFEMLKIKTFNRYT